MAIQAQVLQSAVRICRARSRWTFRPAEIVAALPWLNPGSVRTHVMSRCCVNAPPNHAHRWPYFRRIGRGTYEVLPAARSRPAKAVAEAGVAYIARPIETEPAWDPVLRAYGKGIDRTLLRESLKRSVAERLAVLERWMKDAAELRGAAGKKRP